MNNSSYKDKDKDVRNPRRISVWIKLTIFWFGLVAFGYGVYFTMRGSQSTNQQRLSIVHQNAITSTRNEQQNKYRLRKNKNNVVEDSAILIMKLNETNNIVVKKDIRNNDNMMNNSTNSSMLQSLLGIVGGELPTPTQDDGEESNVVA